MSALKLIVYILVLLSVFVGFAGCDSGGCGNSCKGGIGCPPNREECRCVADRRGCSNFSFNEKSGKCNVSGCDSCQLFVGLCGDSNTNQQDIAASEFVTVFTLDEGCDVISNAVSKNDCGDIAIDRYCESFEFTPSVEDIFQNECFIYECLQCSL